MDEYQNGKDGEEKAAQNDEQQKEKTPPKQNCSILGEHHQILLDVNSQKKINFK
jgi:hypothetical protein